VAQYYPGTKIGISEYGWGDMKALVPALAEVDVLGIFGREGVDLACLFGPPKATEAGANAFRLYRNYDGQGGKYGDTWVRSVSGDQGKLAVYAAERTADHTLTIIVINKTAGDLTSMLSLANWSAAGSARVFRFSGSNLGAVVPQAGVPIQASGFTATYPARSATLFVIPRG